MSIPFIERLPNGAEIERFRLLLGRYPVEQITSPMFQLMNLSFIKKTIIEAFGLTNIQEPDEKRIIVVNENADEKYILDINSYWFLETMQAKEKECSFDYYKEHLSRNGINADNFREDLAKSGVCSVEVLYHMYYDEDVERSKSAFLCFRAVAGGKVQLRQYSYFVDPTKLTWRFEGTTDNYRYIRFCGYDKNKVYEILLPTSFISRNKNQVARTSSEKSKKPDHRRISIRYFLDDSQLIWSSESLKIESLSEQQIIEYNAMLVLKKQKGKAIAELEDLIALNAEEKDFQALLSKNWWMFGNEYGELLDRRTWTRDNQQDFMVRRTADGFLEIIEIKRPMSGEALFIKDKSHNSWYPGAELSKAIGQVIHYIDKLDSERHSIFFNDGEDINKIRAKLIIGLDGDNEQKNTLRNLNSHLYRIEIITYEQLLRIAKRSVEYQ